MVLNPKTCFTSGRRQFDTNLCANHSEDLVAYLDALHVGAVVLGMTADEPTAQLGPALRTLQAYGVFVADVMYREKFAFILQKGFPEKTVVNKGKSGSQIVQKIRVQVEG